ncbi:MAG TPA: hypothetical protein PL155_09110 [Candidatus Omnitrophota bacterium]|nr:hypothetical protein [Candidatus Omnitrophota bacterium]HPD85663.1 hypothetical protein [Candidatus Omnitrophota bacterium]HRZ04506.1 hypothetical protein [Candidatus Omnitrophota bacterium]
MALIKLDGTGVPPYGGTPSLGNFSLKVFYGRKIAGEVAEWLNAVAC